MAKKMSDFDKAAVAVGTVADERKRNPFVNLKEAGAGAFVAGNLIGEHEYSFTPKKGKNKGKKQTATAYDIEVSASNVKEVTAGGTYALSVGHNKETGKPGGLIGYLLNKARPAGLVYPFPIAIKYDGQDGEDFHKWEVRYPKAAAK